MTEKFTLFYNGEFSQFHNCKFTVDEITFHSAEMFMMYCKAISFGDFEIAKKIIVPTNKPHDCKMLGRAVSGFQEDIWVKTRKIFVRAGNIAKFSQNPDLLVKLLSTRGTTLVECSPVDKIWGIGRDIKDRRCLDRNAWNGLNLLGECLTEVRNILS